MSTLQSWVDDLARMPGIDSDHWKTFRHAHSAAHLQAEQLDDALAALGPVSGWLVEPSSVRELHAQAISLRQRPLSAEFFRPGPEGGAQSWQLAYRPGHGWCLDAHTLEPCQSADANCLAEPAWHLHAHRPGARLAYWRLWKPDSSGAPACGIALLCDIQESNR